MALACVVACSGGPDGRPDGAVTTPPPDGSLDLGGGGGDGSIADASSLEARPADATPDAPMSGPDAPATDLRTPDGTDLADSRSPPDALGPQRDCGKPGQRCCAAHACQAGGCCVYGRCVADGQNCGPPGTGRTCRQGSCGGCGAIGEPCCPRASETRSASCTQAYAACGDRGRCVACGVAGATCCDGSLCFDELATCEGSFPGPGVCTACGGTGQRCCDGGRCAAGNCCSGGVCLVQNPQTICDSCGRQGEKCCAVLGGRCGGGLACDGSRCVSCGERGQPCCSGLVCNGGELVCKGGTCQTCGGAGAPCCDGGACTNGLACSFGGCTACGGPQQPCCPGSTCNAGGCCVSGTCTANGLGCRFDSTCTNGVCSGCGQDGQTCCPPAQSGQPPPCNAPTLACGEPGPGSCAGCGGPGQTCCPGTLCRDGGCCVDFVCVAAGAQCPGMSATCQAGSCGGCGGVGQPCCPGVRRDQCTAASTACFTDIGDRKVCVECGDQGKACCPTTRQGVQPICLGGTVCFDGFLCSRPAVVP